MLKSEKGIYMKGTFGKLLTIDLGTSKTRSEDIPDSVFEQYLGGKGLGAYLLGRLNPPGVDPLSPDSRLILTTGPACGFPVWGANRYAAFAKSPLTGIFAESYSGGRAFQPMSRIGCDALVLHGAAEEWSVVEISAEGVAFHDAGSLVGKDALESERVLRQRYPGREHAVLTIGPAGEKLVRYAYVNNDQGRCLGRTGIGAILGSKRVKALVFRGSVDKEAADPALLEAFRKEWGKTGRQKAAAAKQLDSARKTLKNVQQMIRLDVLLALKALEDSKARHQLAGQRVELAEESLRITEKQYQAGRATITDLLNDQTVFHQARTDLALVTYQLIIDYTAVRAAAGMHPLPGMETD